MRNLFTFMLGAAMLASYSAPKTYHLAGKAPQELEGDTIFLQVINDKLEYANIDSTVVTNGIFSFNGQQEQPAYGVLKFRPYFSGSRPVPVVIENGDIRAVIDQTSSVTGSPLNDSLTAFVGIDNAKKKGFSDLRALYQELKTKDQYNADAEAMIDQKYDSIGAYYDTQIRNFIQNNNSNVVGAYALSRQLSSMDPQTIEEILSVSTDAFSASPFGKRSAAHAAAVRRSMPGATFTEITMPDMDGNTVSLSDYAGKGKYVLVDFWASWCGPCRRDMPSVVEAYSKYASKGLEIVGVSFDSSADAWKKGVSDLNITWPQMSDLKGWQSAASDIYGIRSIPSTILIGPDGVIVERNIKGEELDAVLAKYMK